MAKKEVQIGINYTVNQQSLNNFKKSLESIRQLTNTDILKINPNFSGKAEAKKELESIRKNAEIVEIALEKAFNPKIGSVNLSKFDQELKKENRSIKDIHNSFNKAGVAGQKAFTNLTTTLMTTKTPLKQTHKVLNEIATTLGNNLRWNIASGAINRLTGNIQEAYGYVKALDKSLNSIQIVTQKNADTMADFAVKANNAAKALGTGTKDYTDAALTFYQQGLSDQDVAARTETTLKVANVTGLNSDVAAEYVTSVANGYKVAADEVENSMDKISAVGAATASSLDELAEGMSKVASTANAMGVSEDQLAATLSTVISVTRQDASTIGTAFKTIYARISDIEAGSEDAEISLGEYTSKMAEMGFSVLDSSGKLKDLGAVMEEIGGSWANLSREQQISLAQTMAGTRQYNNLIALFDNWDAYTKSLNVSMEANGTLQQQQDTYMESTSAHLQTLTTNLEDLYDSLLDTDTINSLSDIFSGLVSGVTTWVDALGGGGQVLLNLGSIAMTVFNKQIGMGLSKTIDNFKTARQKTEEFTAQIKLTDEYRDIDDVGTQRAAQMLKTLTEYSTFMSEEEVENERRHILEHSNLEQERQDWEEKKRKAEEYLKVLEEQSAATKGVLNTDPIEGTQSRTKVSSNVNWSSNETSDTEQETVTALQSLSTASESALSTEEKLKNSTDIINRNVREREQIEQEMLDIKNKALEVAEQNGVVIDEEKSDVEDIIKAYGNSDELNSYTEKLSQIKDLGERINTTFQRLPESVSSLKNDFEILKSSMSEEEAAKYSQAIKKLEETFANPDMTASKFFEDKEAVAALELIQTKFKTTAENIKTNANNTSEAITQKNEESIRKAESEADRFINNLKAKFKNPATLSAVVQLTGSISQITMAIQNLKNIGNIWNNSDISTGEKMAQTFSSIAMVIPMVIMGINGIKTAIKNLKMSSGILIAISIAIMAIVTAVTYIIDAFQSEEKQMKENIKTANELSNAYSQLKESYDSLKTSIEDYESALAAVNKLEKGTYAWKEAIETANEKAKDLMKTNEKFKDFSSIDPLTGLITFDEDAYKKYLAEYRKNTYLTGAASYSAQAQVVQDRNNTQNENFDSNWGKYRISLRGEKDQYVYGLSPEQAEENAKEQLKQKGYTVSGNFIYKEDAPPEDKDVIEGSIHPVIYMAEEENLANTLLSIFQEQGWDENTSSKTIDAYVQAHDEIMGEVKFALTDGIEATRDLIESNNNTSEELKNLNKQITQNALAALLPDYENLTEEQINLLTSLFDLAPGEEKDEEGNITKDDKEEALKDTFGVDSSDQISNELLAEKYAKKQGIASYVIEDDKIVYTDENGDTQEIPIKLAKENLGYQLAVEKKYKDEEENIKKVEKGSNELQKNADLLGQEYGIEGLGNVAQLFLQGKGEKEFQEILAGISSEEQATDFINSFSKLFEDKGLDLTLFSKNLGENPLDSIKNSINSVEYSEDEWNKTIGTSAKGAIDNFTTVSEKVKSGDYTAENIGEKKDYQDLMGELKTIKKEYPELTADVELLNKTWLVGTQEYEDALNRVQDAVAAVDIDKQNKIAEDSIQELKTTWNDYLNGTTEDIEKIDQQYSEEDINIGIDTNTEKFASQMDEILSAQYEIDVAIHTEAENEFDKVSGVLSDIKDKASLIGEDFVVAADDIRELNKTFPGILEGMTILSDGTIKLNQDMVESAMTGAEAEAQADSQALIDKLQNQATLLRAKQKTYETMAKAAAALAQGETTVEGESADAKTIISSKLSELEQYNSQATAETSKDANEEVSKSAKENGEAFAKNWNEAYEQVNKNAYEAAKNQISYMNQVRSGSLGEQQSISTVEYKGTEVVSEETDITRQTKDALNSNSPLEQEWAKISQTFETMAKSAGDQATDIESMIAQIGASAVGLDSTLSNVAQGKGATGETADQIDLLKDELDIYRAINNEIQDITRNLEDLTKQQEKLTGPALIKNLDKQLEILNKQADAYERKLKIAEQETSKYAAQLRGYGVTFDSSNQMANYDALYAQMENSINAQISAYNSLSKSQQTDQKKQEIENSKNQLEKLKEIAGKYDTVINNTLPEIINNLEDISEKEYEIKIEKLDVAIQEATDKTDWSKLYDEFLNRENYLSDDIIGKTLLTAQSDQTRGYLRNQMQTEYKGAQAAVNAMNIIDKGGIDEIYGTDRAKALENAKTYGESLMSNIQDIYNTLDSLNANVITGIEEVDSVYSDLNSTYDNISKTYQNGMKLLKLLYGEDSYAELNNYYQSMQTNYEDQLMNLRNEKEYWLDLMNTVEENSDEWKKYQQNFISASDSLNSTLETAIQNIIDKYTNTINEIFKTLEDKVTNGLGLEYINDEWTLIKDNSEQYLDAINAAYNIQTTKSKYLEAINATDDVKAQQRLNKLMEEQMAQLEAKDKLTEYDVERAEKVLTLEQKRIALEEAQQNKSKMRLRRNAAGDYTYQFVADEDNIAKAKQELLDAENDLYNFDLNEYNESLDRAYEVYSEYQEKVLQVYTDTSLSQEERDKKLYLLNSQYQEALAQASERNTTARINLENSANETIKLYYEDNLEKFNNMIDEDGRLIMEELVPGWSSGVQNMIDEIIKEGGLDNIMQKTLADANRAVQDLSEEEQKTAEIAGADLADIQNATLEEADILSGNVVDAQDSVLNMAKDNLNTVMDIRDEYQNWADDILNTLVPSYDSLIRKINEAIARAQELAAEASRNYSIDPSGYIAPPTSGSGGGSGGSGSNGGGSELNGNDIDKKPTTNTLKTPYVLSTSLHKTIQKKIGDTVSVKSNLFLLSKNRGTKLKYFNGNTHKTEYAYIPAGQKAKIIDIDNSANYPIHLKGVSKSGFPIEGWYKNGFATYDTGGYTGAWGADGRLAMLHQKELVLNAKDTENMLKAVDILRAMTDNLGDSIFNRLASIPNGYGNILNQIPNSETLEQKVQIEAVFPNVSNSHEIENAFNNLVNIASQRALRNKK